MHADDRCVCQDCDPLYCVSNCSMTGSSGQVGCVYREADSMHAVQTENITEAPLLRGF
nr:MAG TPA: hypothetical protein [Caudoviricetes sp.]